MRSAYASGTPENASLNILYHTTDGNRLCGRAFQNIAEFLACQLIASTSELPFTENSFENVSQANSSNFIKLQSPNRP